MNEFWNPMVPELSVSNFKKSLSFYTEILGFKIRIQRDNPDFAYLEQEKVQIMIEAIHHDGWQVDTLSFPFGRGINLQMELQNIEPLYDRLLTANITFFRDKKESWYDTGTVLSGQKEFLIQDPDGYLLRFTQFLGEKTK